ncbi:MAG: Methyltransferase type 11 [Candidatus Gottesmanbacteria bacterium GW2011_GWB1_43_11]|uniref:Methyltransferase type 11 n=1 Tax=Candidatus Gottesmanbacteria bacterium GW2011_GWB1_43_11 TaxID=1618446 RepID=A0A0G1FKM0_9BACT|nr:MAG: Methyltransferase type 11 [Candidatus Gottesmanbacteria bacterium GW2011_GWA2_42_16]KKS56241.1 MAG: Methyltransferase type 11 [Candidatus Gottesmanbacteria bacterium GW2011_GWA1_42_26]KKS82574.1 MAG: Methyltransferase type 11 [Candidatus Gottesmanbacteria bacterium GW2011_GWC1_43_10]KKS87443.1 MAG: Methyltransferase type 11 [Candidatus Gottesmanbacteria bacterium GW2011_GWB1_43_11]OGG10182.1 MAG: hypothetical protein A2699_01385 [Candidatus Gottesmanbacteria bacterium RIFCSPHIGHO2_01_FU
MLSSSQIKNKLLTPIVVFLQKTAVLSAVACRLVKWTGKHKDPIHPKHLVKIRDPWYLEYLHAQDIVLDVGCNNGQHTLKAAKKCKFIYGFDYDRGLLQLAQKEASRLSLKNVEFQIGNAEKAYPYKKQTFNIILFFDVLEHLYEREQALKEIHRVLKPKGKLLLSVPNKDTSWKRLQERLGLPYYSDPDHKVEFTQKTIEQLLNNTGYKATKILPVTLDTPWVGVIDVVGGLSLSAYAAISRWRRQQALFNPKESIGWEIVCIKK